MKRPWKPILIAVAALALGLWGVRRCASSRWERWLFIPYLILLIGYLHVWIGLLVWRKWKYRPLPEGTGVE